MSKACFGNLISHAGDVILKEPPKRIVLSGPSGFLGSRVVRSILQVHDYRRENGLKPGELVILSSRPGRLMERLVKEHGSTCMSTVRASRVDYYTQLDPETWIDNLGSLGLEGENCVFVNLAAVAGPDGGRGGLSLVNYNAPLAAAKACEYLGFGHWIQSSTQATNTERASQVRYSRGKAMCDYALSRLEKLPVTIACLGLLYCKTDGIVGQDDKKGLNLIDLSLLPLTPIMGSGAAPLQPQEVSDASDRLAFLALTDPKKRPVQKTKAYPQSRIRNLEIHESNTCATSVNCDLYTMKTRHIPDTFRKYDAVGPETVTMIELLERFSHYQGRNVFRPVHINYNNMEEILNITSFGNMNRQFLSLLRSEQESDAPLTGDSQVWESILGENCKLTTLNEAFSKRYQEQLSKGIPPRQFPYWTTFKIVLFHPRVIWPGIKLSLEIMKAFLEQYSHTNPSITPQHRQQASSFHK